MKKTSDLDIQKHIAVEFVDEKQRIIAERKNAAKEKSDQQEFWMKIVVKVIRWSEGNGPLDITDDKYRITAKEWRTYSERWTEINVNQNPKKIAEELKETKKKIESYGGFVKN